MSIPITSKYPLFYDSGKTKNFLNSDSPDLSLTLLPSIVSDSFSLNIGSELKGLSFAKIK